MTSAPGKVGKSYPIGEGQHSSNNTAPTQQVNVGERYGWVVALLIGIAALILAIMMIVAVRSMSTDIENVRGLIENSARAAAQSAVEAALASERADKAERSAALSREYAVQVYPQLNRLGYPIMSPGEENHPAAQVEDYQRLQNFVESKK